MISEKDNNLFGAVSVEAEPVVPVPVIAKAYHFFLMSLFRVIKGCDYY